MPSFTHITCIRDGALAVVTFLDPQIQRDELTDKVREELSAACEQTPVDHWVLDFRHVEFFSSAGVPPLLTLHRKLQSRRSRVLLCNVKSIVADMFRVTHLVREAPGQPRPFELATTLEDALLRLRHVRADFREGVLVLTLAEKELHGDDLAEEMGAEMLHRWQAAQAPAVIIDFAAVQVISTPCMRPLLNLRTHVRQNGGRIVFASLAPQVREIFEVTRLTAPSAASPALFETAADIASAVGLLKAPT
jgi:anti-anti-sigma factor